MANSSYGKPVGVCVYLLRVGWEISVIPIMHSNFATAYQTLTHKLPKCREKSKKITLGKYNIRTIKRLALTAFNSTFNTSSPFM